MPDVHRNGFPRNSSMRRDPADFLYTSTPGRNVPPIKAQQEDASSTHGKTAGQPPAPTPASCIMDRHPRKSGHWPWQKRTFHVRSFITTMPRSAGIVCSTARRAIRRPHPRSAARISDQLLHVPRSHSGTCGPLSRHRARPPRLRLSDAPSVDEFDYTFDALTDLTEGCCTPSGSTVRDLRAGLRCPDRVAPRAAQPVGDHRDHQPERQCLCCRIRRNFWKTVQRLPGST